MFSKELEVSISQAYQEARTARHEFLTVEHLLLAADRLARSIGFDVPRAVPHASSRRVP